MSAEATTSIQRQNAGSARSATQSLQEYARGVTGGLLFSLPLLYTMEVWFTGFSAHPLRLIVYVLATFALLLGYNRYAGLREDSCFTEVVIDSVEEMGLGLLLAALVLWLLGRFNATTPITDITGQIITEAMTVAIGVSVGTAQLGTSSERESGESDDSGHQSGFQGQLVIALCGAVLFAANVAPTEEIVQIAVETTVWKLIGLVVLSLALGTMILYASDFDGADQFVRGDSRLSILVGLVTTYAVALVASALILWFFGRFDGVAFSVCVAQVVVLGVAATLGATAGRLLLQ